MGKMGDEKSTKNQLKQRRLVWLNVPQTAPRQIPVDSHSEEYLGRSGSLVRCCSVHPERQLHLYSPSYVSLNQYEFCTYLQCYSSTSTLFWRELWGIVVLKISHRQAREVSGKKPLG